MMLTFMLGFALVWYVWWLALISCVGLIVAIIIYSFQAETEEWIAADIIQRHDETWRVNARAAAGVSRALETSTKNNGKAISYTEEQL